MEDQTKPQFAVLHAVPVRKAWPVESQNFTPWLAGAENLALLGDEIGIDLETVQTEFGIGGFYLDILARRTDTQELVVIENQFGKTDHGHLGQLLTYAAGASTDGNGARTVIWIAEEFREEHRAALDWLNRTSESGIGFFGVELELWQIADSPFAPKFNVIAKPNEWQKQVTQNASALSDVERLYLDFWDGFYKFCDEIGTTLVFSRTPRKISWLPTKSGFRGFGINLNAVRRDSRLEVHLWIDREDDKESFKRLKKRESEILQLLGSDVHFDDMEGKQASKIFTLQNWDFEKRESWNTAYAWLNNAESCFSPC